MDGEIEEVPKELADDLEQRGLGCWQAFRFFVKHSYQDVGRRKCHFCLAFCSVLIVVLSTLVVNTVTNKGPIIFMKLAQESSGEIDCVYTVGGKGANSNEIWDDRNYMNYTGLVDLLKEENIEHNLAPRYE